MNIIKKIKNLDWGSILPLLKQSHKLSKRSYIWLLNNAYHAMKEGYTFEEYFTYDFASHTDKEYRESFIATHIHFPKISAYFHHNPKNYSFFNDKGLFNQNFKDIKGIDSLDLRVDSLETFEKFIDKHESWFAKTPSDCGGHGVKRENRSLFSNCTVESIYNSYKNDNYVVVEEEIHQHEEVSKLSLNSVNTLRVITARDENDNISIPFVVSRISIGDSYKDNTSEGGAWCLLSKDGTVEHDYFSNVPILKTFSENPYTGFKFKNFKFPFFEEAKNLCQAAALRCDNHLIGWDVAITKNGPCIIEANDSPGPALMQAPNQLENGYGRLNELESALKISLHN